MLKKLFHKLLFITPLLGLTLTYANGIGKTMIEYNRETIIVRSSENNLKALSLYFEVEESNDYSEFFYEEFDPEDDFELFGLILISNIEAFTSSIIENQKLYDKTSFCLLQQSTPLYDLFCNWKHYLS